MRIVFKNQNKELTLDMLSPGQFFKGNEGGIYLKTDTVLENENVLCLRVADEFNKVQSGGVLISFLPYEIIDKIVEIERIEF